MVDQRFCPGLIVNPVAGMGGAVGLKGTDEVAHEALARGAVPRAGHRAARALSILAGVAPSLDLLTCDGAMGMDAAVQAGIRASIVYRPAGAATGAGDTVAAARQMVQAGVNLILFAGGDGTARDMVRAVGERVTVIGIPAGVKIHSPVYAISPQRAGQLAREVILGRIRRRIQAEVLDIDEAGCRRGIVNTRLYGYLTVPDSSAHTQSRKAGSPVSEKASQHRIAQAIIDRMQPGVLFIIGPGSTTLPILTGLGLDGTLLGVDLVRDRALVCKDAGQQEIKAHLGNSPCKIVVTPVGGQGFVFGRGNQQIGPWLLSGLEKSDIIVAATREKISHLNGRPLWMDTGDPATDKKLSGYYRVVTGYNEELVYAVRAG